MTPFAYDDRERPAVPRPIEINVNATALNLRRGAVLAKQGGCDPDDFPSLVWASLVDAARVERSLPTPGPRGYTSGWPDCWHTDGEITGAYNDRLAERRDAAASGVTYDEGLYGGSRAGLTPRSAEITAYETAASWLRLCHAADKRRAIRIVWLRAHGRPYGLIARLDGRSAKQVREVRSTQLAIIVMGLKSRLAGTP